MADTIELVPVHPEHSAVRRSTAMDVVYIHGLDGDAGGTWRHNAQCWWPQWIADDHPRVQVWCLGYPAKIGHLSRLGASSQLNSTDLATACLGLLRDRHIGQRPCIFVCHSLGGLLAKRLLLEANRSEEVDRFQHDNVAAIMFLATPHRGSAVADVLDRLAGAKNVAIKVITATLGFGVVDLGSNVLTTTALIDELKQGAAGLQELNETFGQYYAERHSRDPMRVRVFAETAAMQVAGFPTKVVVDFESANPNLKPRAGASPVVPVKVPGADHSSIVKLTEKDGLVWQSLCKLIADVGTERGSFAFDDPLRNEVARGIYSATKERPLLVGLPSLAALAVGLAPMERAHALAESLADTKGKSLNEATAMLENALHELAAGPGLTKGDVDALEQAAGWLVTLALLERQAIAPARPAPAACVEFSVPVVHETDDADAQGFLNLTIEVCHASLRQWPTRWSLADDNSTVLPGSWVMQSEALSHHSSWHDADHLAYLVERINASAAQGRRPQALVLQSGPSLGESSTVATDTPAGDLPRNRAAPTAAPPRSAFVKQTRAKALIRSRFGAQTGLVIAAVQSGSPYQSETLRSTLASLFGPLVAIALPEPRVGAGRN